MEIYDKASELPEEWDSFCSDNYAMQRSFLNFMEMVNYCGQKYYIFRNTNNCIDSVLMTLQLKKFNISMFTPITFRVNVTLIYVPLSIAKPGFKIGVQTKREVEDFLKSIKGYWLMLNVRNNLDFNCAIRGATCSNIVLDVKAKSLDEYLLSLRSSYRRRCMKALSRGKDLGFRILENNREFSDEHYSLYKQVHDHSGIQVENLSKEYFQSSKFIVIECNIKDKVMGFVQLYENKEELVFVFIGFDYEYNNQYDIYLNLLLKIIEYAVEKGFTQIDLGQTADEAKLRLGGKYFHLSVLISHSNPVITFFLGLIIHSIEYKPLKKTYRVFKEDVLHERAAC